MKKAKTDQYMKLLEHSLFYPCDTIMLLVAPTLCVQVQWDESTQWFITSEIIDEKSSQVTSPR